MTKRQVVMKRYLVEYRVVIRGSSLIEAVSAEDAEAAYVEKPEYDHTRDELVDWAVVRVKEQP